MTTTSPWNDPTIPDDECLYRRVPRKPDYYLQRDLETGEMRLGRAAFQFDDDGMSVYRHALIFENELTASQIRRNESNDLWRFTAGAARKLSVGVVDDPDENDLPIGAAHASVRGFPDFRPAEKKARRTIALGLVAAAEFVPGEIS